MDGAEFILFLAQQLKLLINFNVYLEAERRRAGNGLAKGGAEAQATRLRTYLAGFYLE